MTILEAFKDDKYALRVIYDYRWVYYDSNDNCWIVCERKPYQHNTKTIIQTHNEEMAVQFLLQ
jgi:hypothetical protein